MTKITLEYEHENDTSIVVIEKKKQSLFERLKQKFKFKKSKKSIESSKKTSSLISKSKDTSISFTESHTDSDSINTFTNCTICLNNFGSTQSIPCKLFELNSCKCKFCINCLYEYIKESIENCNVLPINCPDSKCKSNGHLNSNEIKSILFYRQYAHTDINNNNNDDDNNTCDNDSDCENNCFFKINDDGDKFNLYNKYLKICENLEILRDPLKTYCPKPSCQNVCNILPDNLKSSNFKVVCDKCDLEFCSKCSKTFSQTKRKASLNLELETDKIIQMDVCDCNLLMSNEILNKNFQKFENIKRCPNCSILIERADGCAQVMCKICKHTFCFYCLTSLENDYLLKHYTKDGPCKGKLGHSRISLFFHRLSVIAVFSGTFVLLIILSPFLLFALPCIVLNKKNRNNCLDKLTTKFG